MNRLSLKQTVSAMAGQKHDRGTDGEREARRILDRIARETEPGSASPAARATRAARDHLAAADVEPDDRIEYWGTRIGRVLGLLLALGMMVWLGLFLFNRG